MLGKSHKVNQTGFSTPSVVFLALAMISFATISTAKNLNKSKWQIGNLQDFQNNSEISAFLVMATQINSLVAFPQSLGKRHFILSTLRNCMCKLSIALVV